jgi:hypothetical protein
MSQPVSPPQEPSVLVLLRKFVLMALWMLVVSIGLVALLVHVRPASPALMLFFADSILGLAVGLSDRWLLRKRTVVLRFTAALAFVAAGLKLLGWFTGAPMGIASIYSRRLGMDWSGLVQFLVSGLVALLAVFAWRRKRSVPKPSPVPEPVQPAEGPEESPAQAPQPVNRIKKVPSPVSASPTQDRESLSVKQPAKKTSKPRRINRRKLRLRLSGEEEHRCPYCLEPIEADDPRGVVECQICHTLHHADCWAITGACQVPHYSE